MVEGNGSGHDSFRVRGASEFRRIPGVDIVHPALFQCMGSPEVRTSSNVNDTNDWVYMRRTKSDEDGDIVISTS